MNKVVGDDWLLDTSSDYFYFVTKFFEPIKASATHIYSSALELSPTSSIVRKLYYDRYNRITLLPRVVVGTPDSWDQRVSHSSEDYEHYKSCTWSPCGRFIAAQTRTAVEIRNQHTLELFTTLQPTEPAYQLTGPLAYPTDGRSIACASEAGILIWDIQTGGVAKKIACGPNVTSIVWSSDGRTIAITSGMESELTDPYTWSRVRTYDVASGIGLFVEEIQSCGVPFLWEHKTSFQIARMSSNPGCATIEVFEIGSTLMQAHSFDITDPWIKFFGPIWSISPTASRFSLATHGGLCIIDYQNLNVVLEQTGCFESHHFSSDGNFFAASTKEVVHIWRYCSGHYIPWETYLCRSSIIFPLHFSPAASLILERSANTLQVRRLHDLPTSFSRPRDKYAGVTPSGNYIVTALKYGRTVTIISLHSQIPQFIDVDAEIKGLFLTGNVLLVHGPSEIVAWLLTEAGRVDGVFDNQRAGRSNSIWEISKYSFMPVLPNFMVDAGRRVGAIGGYCLLYPYHTETGEVLQSVSILHPIYSRPLDLVGVFRGRHYDAIDWPTHKGDWGTSRATLQDGWVKDLEGSCRLWVPVEWRASWDSADWVRSAATQFSIVEDELVIVNF